MKCRGIERQRAKLFSFEVCEARPSGGEATSPSSFVARSFATSACRRIGLILSTSRNASWASFGILYQMDGRELSWVQIVTI